LKAIETGAGDAARVLDDIDPGLFSNFAQGSVTAQDRGRIAGERGDAFHAAGLT
jgi:hypothetical protein